MLINCLFSPFFSQQTNHSHDGSGFGQATIDCMTQPFGRNFSAHLRDSLEVSAQSTTAAATGDEESDLLKGPSW